MHSKTNTVLTILALAALASVAGADIGYFESFESSTDTWFDYQSELTRVPSGTNGIDSYHGDYHMTITDPDSLPEGYWSGAFSRLGGYSTSFGTGFKTSAAVYIDLADPQVAAGTYGFDLSQAINGADDAHKQDNIFHVGAVPDGSGGYDVLLSASHNSDWALNPYKLINSTLGTSTTFTESGWYTFEYTFVPSATPDSVDIGFKVYDAAGDEFWSADTISSPAQYTLSNVGGNRYMWFVYAAADSLAVDAVSQVAAGAIPEPATFAVWGLLGCLALGASRFRR